MSEVDLKAEVEIHKRNADRAYAAWVEARADLERIKSGVHYAKSVLEMQEWWNDPGHSLYHIRFALEDVLYPRKEASA